MHVRTRLILPDIWQNIGGPPMGTVTSPLGPTSGIPPMGHLNSTGWLGMNFQSGYTMGILWVALLGPRAKFSSVLAVSLRSSRASQSHMYNNPYAAVMAVTHGFLMRKVDGFVTQTTSSGT